MSAVKGSILWYTTSTYSCSNSASEGGDIHLSSDARSCFLQKLLWSAACTCPSLRMKYLYGMLMAWQIQGLCESIAADPSVWQECLLHSDDSNAALPAPWADCSKSWKAILLTSALRLLSSMKPELIQGLSFVDGLTSNGSAILAANSLLVVSLQTAFAICRVLF